MKILLLAALVLIVLIILMRALASREVNIKPTDNVSNEDIEQEILRGMGQSADPNAVTDEPEIIDVNEDEITDVPKNSGGENTEN